MKYPRFLASLLILGLAATMAPAVKAADHQDRPLTVNGTVLSHAVSIINAKVEVTEFRDATSPNVVKLIPGAKQYRLCIVSKGPLKMFDAELPVADTPDRFAVGVEDGREFSRCLLTGLKQVEKSKERFHDGRGRLLYRYCLRCEDVTATAP